MSVSYEKLKVIMVRYKINGETLRKGTGISTTEAAKINKDIYMTLQSAERIARYLSKTLDRRVRIEDFIDFKED